MPMNPKLYPSDWKAIATRIKNKAEWTCQNCQRPCRKPHVSWVDFSQWLLGTGQIGWYDDGFEVMKDGTYKEHMHRFTLTVAHLDHRPENCSDENLKALCFPCHARYDVSQMALKRSLKKERKGQLSLFFHIS